MSIGERTAAIGCRALVRMSGRGAVTDQRSRSTSAFTLLELLVVLVIAGLLTALVAVRFQAPYRAAQLESSLERIELLDFHARQHARSCGRECRIVFDLDHGQMHMHARTIESDRHFEFRLSRSLRIARVLSLQQSVVQGRASIDISRHGTSPTYAVCVHTAEDTERWLLFSGLTGRVIHPRNEADVQHLFDIERAPRLDAP